MTSENTGLVFELADDGVPASVAHPPPKVKVKRRGKITRWLATTWLTFIVFMAVFAPLLGMYDPLKRVGRIGHPSPPFGKFFLGTDMAGLDLFSRVVYGARVSLIVGFSAIIFGLFIGGSLGLIAGFYRKSAERWIMGGTDVLLAFPALVLALLITTFLRPAGGVPTYGVAVRNVILALGILSIAPFARIVRASTLVFSEREFVLAARALGASNKRIIVKEILPNIVPQMISFAFTGTAIAIVAEGALSFLGLSVPIDKAPSWGAMINIGRKDLDRYPHIVFVPAATMFLTILSFNLIGDVISSRSQVREGGL
jgi:peptide/nickel transport system permease protein